MNVQNLSLADQLAAMPKADQDEFFRPAHRRNKQPRFAMTGAAFSRVQNQIEPEGEWDHWMIMAGRGFGKTRSGAEWVREQVDQGARCIALIAEDAERP